MTQSTNSTAVSESAIAAAAERLASAAAAGVPCAPIRDLIGADDLVAAYQVQERVNDLRMKAGAVVVGRKIGLTSVAVQQQLGVNQPDLGVLFDDMQYADGDDVPMSVLIQPKIEGEVGFVLGVVTTRFKEGTEA